MKKLAAAAAVALLLTACAPDWLPPGAYLDGHGCINVDRTPPYPRLDFRRVDHQPIGHWYFDGREFGWSFEEDGCIRPD
jgi:hypothetical protein